MINPISNNPLLNAVSSPNSQAPLPANSDPTLIAFGEIIDQIVQASNQSYQQTQQAAIQKAEKEAELQKQIAFLSGAVEQAEAGLSGAQGNSAPPPNTAPAQTAGEGLDYHQQQVVFWKEKLIQAEIPDGDTGDS